MTAPSLYDHPDLYDLVMDTSQAEAFYLKLARDRSGPVLELGCGTGRLASAMAGAGRDVTGLDRAPLMLEAARHRAMAKKIVIDWIEADMRDFAIDRRFGFIFIANNTLLHLETNEDLIRCLSAAARHLESDGVLAFDAFNPALRRYDFDPEARREVGRFEHPSRGEVRLDEQTRYEAETRMSRRTWFFSADGKPDFLAVPVDLRNVFADELAPLAREAGLKLIRRYGDFRAKPFTDRSPLQICLCAPLPTS